MELVAVLTNHKWDRVTIDDVENVAIDLVTVGNRFHGLRVTKGEWPGDQFVDEDDIASCRSHLSGSIVPRVLAEKVAQPCKRCFE